MGDGDTAQLAAEMRAARLFHDVGLDGAIRCETEAQREAARQKDKERARAHKAALAVLRGYQRRRAFGQVMASIGLAICGAGFLVLLAQCVYWLYAGLWLPLPIGVPLAMAGLFTDGAASIEWKGAAKILDWVLRYIPTSITLVFGGGWLAAHGSAEADWRPPRPSK